MIEDKAYAHQEFGIYCVAQEYIVYIRTVTVKFAGKPRHRAFLPLQFCLNTTPDMYHSNVSWFLALHKNHPKKTKDVRTVPVARLMLQGSRIACSSKRATRKPHADMYIRHLISYTSRHDPYNNGV